MRKVLLHKLVVSAEAKFDYEENMVLGDIPEQDIVKEIEEHLSFKQQMNKLGNVKYLRLKYFDEKSVTMLMMFVYRRDIISINQVWELCGICEEDNWTEELDDDGIIRGWIKSEVEVLTNEDDWVEEYRIWEEEKIEYQQSYNIVGTREESKWN